MRPFINRKAREMPALASLEITRAHADKIHDLKPVVKHGVQGIGSDRKKDQV